MQHKNIATMHAELLCPFLLAPSLLTLWTWLQYVVTLHQKHARHALQMGTQQCSMSCHRTSHQWKGASASPTSHLHNRTMRDHASSHPLFLPHCLPHSSGKRFRALQARFHNFQHQNAVTNFISSHDVQTAAQHHQEPCIR
jgi:hypothetical protein